MRTRDALKAVIAVLLVAALLYIADISKLLENLARADLETYLLGIAVFLTTYPAAAYRWKRLSAGIGYDLSLMESFRLVAVSYSFNKLFPGNAGDVARSKVLERYREVESHGEVLGVVALERYFTVLALLSVVMVSIPFLGFRFEGVRWILLLFTGLAAALSLGLLVRRDRSEFFLRYLPLSGFVDSAMSGYRSSSRRDLAYGMVCSLYIRGAEAAAFFLFILSLDAGIGFWDGAFVTSIMSLVSALPVSPAGIGPVDATGAGLLVLAGMGYSAALSLVVLQRGAGLVLMALVGVAVYLAEEYLL